MWEVGEGMTAMTCWQCSIAIFAVLHGKALSWSSLAFTFVFGNRRRMGTGTEEEQTAHFGSWVGDNCMFSFPLFLVLPPVLFLVCQ